MTRASGSRWTAEPSRFADWSRRSAAATLLALAAALVASMLAGPGGLGGDPTLYAGAIEAVRHGGAYYQVLGDELRSSGQVVGLLAFPSPTLAVVLAPLPLWVSSALLAVLAGAVFLAWQPVLDRALTRPAARVGAWLLLGAGLALYLRPSVIHVPEVWAGLLLALSLGRWARGAWVEAAAFGLAAALVREVAGLYLAVMLCGAVVDGARREALAWGAAMAVLAAVVAAHWRAVRTVLGPLEGVTNPAPTMAFDAPLDAIAAASPIGLLSDAAAAAMLIVVLFGWTAWIRPAGIRLVATLIAIAALICWHSNSAADWGYLVAAPLLPGLLFAPEGLSNLLRAAGKRRRRITVTRVVR